jgi:DNA-binding NarL/FixJ family response regulator
MNKIKYAIAHDHPTFRHGIISTLSDTPELTLVLEAENGKELLNGLQKNKPDIILLDIKMPVMDGIEAAQQIRKSDDEVKILMMSWYEDEKYILKALESGANGYLVLNAEPEEIKKAIFTVCENGYYFNELVNKALLKKVTSNCS